jgi:fluoride ion exporter CrcB/FEX
MNMLLVALGGALGSTARYIVDGAVYRLLPATFPYGTFVVNVTACGVFGMLIGLSEDRLRRSKPSCRSLTRWSRKAWSPSSARR